MNLESKSEAVARSMLNQYATQVVADLGESVSAILLVGSLATGSYIPGPGDIDQITILEDSAPERAEVQVLQLINETMSSFDGAINMATVVYRQHDLERPWTTQWNLQPETKHLVTVPEELLRIHDHAQVLYSHLFDLSTLPVPNTDEMLGYMKRWKKWNDAYQRNHPAPDPMPVRLLVQTILSRAIWDYYFATGRTCFNKHEIAARISREVPEYRFQTGLDAATNVRLSLFECTSDDTKEVLTTCYKDMVKWSRMRPVGSVPK